MRPKIRVRPLCADGTQAHHTFTDAQLVERCIKEGCTLVIDHKVKENVPKSQWMEYAQRGQVATRQRKTGRPQGRPRKLG